MAAMHLNSNSFQQMMKEGRRVLVDFWAPWCTYCRRIEGVYDRIAQEYEGRLIVAKVNIDEEPELAQREQIEVIPTLVLYEGGTAVGSIVAPESKGQIEAFIAETLEEQAAQQPEHTHDVAIIGGGPGGYTAALYAARAGLDVLVIEKLSAGGQMALTHQIDNYPGFEEGVDGYTLAQKMQRQAERFGAKTMNGQVIRADLASSPKRLETDAGVIRAKAVIIATGAGPRELGVSNERELIGRGVNYCAACDGMFYKDKTVVVVGGGNSAAADAALLSRLAKKVILVHRRDTLRATKVYHEPLMRAENVEFRWNSVVKELLHEDKVKGVQLENVQSGETMDVPCDGVFISVGRKPASQLFEGQVELDRSGYIVAGEDTKTNLPGVYAVGDVRTKALRQIVTAVADGAVAVHHAEEYITLADAENIG